MESCLLLGTLATLCSVLTTAAVAPSVPFRSAAPRAALARAGARGGLLPQPPSGRRLARLGELRESLDDYVALGEAGRPKSSLHEQGPRVAAPLLSVDFPRFGWRRHEGSAPAEI